MAPGSIENSVLECLAENHGISGSLERLYGENLNYFLSTSEGEHYVVKIVDDHMLSVVIKMEFEAQEYAISGGFPLQLPRIIGNIHRKKETGIKIHTNSLNRLLLMSYIDGKQLEDISDISDILLKNVGISLAQYNLAMLGFDYPAARRNHRWNLAEAGQHRDKISLVEDPEKQTLLAWGLDAWEEVKSNLKSLPWLITP